METKIGNKSEFIPRILPPIPIQNESMDNVIPR
jgi:hypothetical protein